MILVDKLWIRGFVVSVVGVGSGCIFGMCVCDVLMEKLVGDIILWS
jgi:hypothetical protein